MHRLLRAGILITFGMLITCIISGCGDDDPPEEVTDPPQSEYRVKPPRATKVEVIPGGGTIPTNTEFTLTFNQKVVAVTVNDIAARGSGRVWKTYLPLGEGDGQVFNVKWVNQDGSMDTTDIGPYGVADGHNGHPVITSATVIDGAVDVDPALINAGGFRFDFDEDVTGTLKLTNEAGVDLNWIADVAGSTATLTPVAGQELVSGTTYMIEIEIRNGVGDRFQWRITFVTKPK